MIFLQTPNISSPSLLSILFKDVTRIYNYFNSSILLHVMPQFSYTNTAYNFALWYLTISEIRSVFTWIYYQQTLIFPIFHKYFFHIFVYIAWDIFTFLSIIGYKPSCSHKYCLLSIKKCLFFLVLLVMILNGHKGSLG